jgi:hypothetical protein
VADYRTAQSCSQTHKTLRGPQASSSYLDPQVDRGLWKPVGGDSLSSPPTIGEEVNEMSMPGFTAEASLGKTRGHYHGAHAFTQAGRNALLPAQW